MPAELATSEEAWRRANPALGIRITAEHVAAEQRSMDARTFAVERLNIGDWPATEDAKSVIDIAAWRALADPGSTMLDPVAFAFDVSPNRDWATIAAAGTRPDGQVHVETIDRRRGTGWLVERMAELQGKHKPSGTWCDERGPAASLIGDMEDAGVTVQTLSTTDYVQACGAIFDAVSNERVRHLGTPELEAAVRAASKRPLGDAWAWSRKASGADITPLVAATVALFGHSSGCTPWAGSW